MTGPGPYSESLPDARVAGLESALAARDLEVARREGELTNIRAAAWRVLLGKAEPEAIRDHLVALIRVAGPPPADVPNEHDRGCACLFCDMRRRASREGSRQVSARDSEIAGVAAVRESALAELAELPEHPLGRRGLVEDLVKLARDLAEARSDSRRESLGSRARKLVGGAAAPPAPPSSRQLERPRGAVYLFFAHPKLPPERQDIEEGDESRRTK